MDVRPLASLGTSLVMRGILAILFGILTLAWPGVTAAVLVVLFGVWAIADGLVGLAAIARGAPTRHRALAIIAAIASLVAGVLAFVWPAVTFFALVMIIAVWAIVIGSTELLAAGEMRTSGGEGYLVLRGVLSIAFGVIALVWPAAGAAGLLAFVGLYALVVGAVMLGLGLRVRRTREAIPL